LNSVIQWGITTEDFTMAEPQGYFKQLVAYHTAPETIGSVWGPQALQQKFPHLRLCADASMTTDALCLEVRKDRIRIEGRQLVHTAIELFENNPEGAVSLLQETAAKLRNDCTPRKVDVHLADALERNWNAYCSAERGERVSVFEWPWAPFQSATLGVRSTDYIIFYGRPKSMKSWILCYLVAFMLHRNAAYRILIYSKEMDADEIFERIGCVLAGIAYENWVSNRLTGEERRMYITVMEFMRQAQRDMTVVCLSAQDIKQGQDTVAWLESKIEQYRPEAVFVDGMYLMSDLQGAKKNHERVANISRAMRQLILHKKVPVIATVQANREAAKNEEANTEEVAFSDSLGQDATMLIRIVNEWKKGANTLALVMGGTSRRYKLAGIRIYGIPAHNFSYYGELSEKEATAALKVDNTANQGTKQRAVKPMTKKAEDEVAQGLAAIGGLIKNA